MKQEVLGVFTDFYLDDATRSIKQCIRLTELALQESNPELLPLPSYSAFSEAAAEIPRPYVDYFRNPDFRRKNLKSFIRERFADKIITCPCCCGKIALGEAAIIPLSKASFQPSY